MNSSLELKVLNSVSNDSIQSSKHTVSSYLSYLVRNAEIGRLDIVKDMLDDADSFIKENEEAFLSNGDYQFFISLFEKVNLGNFFNVKRFFGDSWDIDDLTSQINIFNVMYSTSNPSREEKVVYSFLASLALASGKVNGSICLSIFNSLTKSKLYFTKLQKEVFTLKILELCSSKGYSDLFKFPLKGYNHVHLILEILSHMNLSKFDRDQYTYLMLSKIKEVNNLKPNKNNKIAVCISGLYRGNVSTLNTIYNNLVSPLGADVFVHAWDEQTAWAGLGGNSLMNRCFSNDGLKLLPIKLHKQDTFKVIFPHVFEAMNKVYYIPLQEDEIIKALKPLKIIIDNQDDFIAMLGTGVEQFKKQRGSLNQIKMFYGIKKSMDMALEYSNYDYVIRVRPDMIIDGLEPNFSIASFEKNVIYANLQSGVSFGDGIFGLSSSMAYDLSRYIDFMFEKQNVSPYDEFPHFDSHNIICAWVVENRYAIGKSVTKGRLDVLSNNKQKVPFLDEAIKKDCVNLSESDRKLYDPFISYLKLQLCA